MKRPISLRWLALLSFAAIVVGACGTRTSPLVDTARVRDAGIAPPRLDASFDAGRDLGGDMAVRVPCRADRDCPGETLCRAPASIVAADLAPVPLFCEPPTPRAAADGEGCGGRDGSECARGLCVVAGACVAPCTSADDCPGLARCAEVFVRTGVDALQPLQACTPVVAAPPDVGARIDRAVAASAGGFSPVDVAIDHSGVTTLAVFAAQSGEDLFLQALRDPSGTAVFDLAALGPGLPSQPNPVNPNAVALTVLLPSGLDIAAGAYRAELLSDAPAPVDRIVLQRTGSGRTLDLDLYFVAGRLFGGPDAPISPELRRAIDVFRTFCAGVGIELGELRTHELVGGLARRYASLEADADGRIPELDALFALTAGARGASVSWFFVRDAEGVLGVSGGVPGAQCLPGTAASGIAISADLLGSGVPLESVLIHETGHFLGLFHTIEMDGSELDPFADTPGCGPDRDVNGDGFLEPGECIGAGADNVMFWSGTDARVISPSQRALVRRALLLR